jgi:hypothetical protein
VTDVLACTVSHGDLHRGDLVAADDPRVARSPASFVSWVSPLVATGSGVVVGSGPVVSESFATGDRVLLRGDVLDPADPLVQQVARCVTAWSLPTVRLVTGELVATPAVPVARRRGRRFGKRGAR